MVSSGVPVIMFVGISSVSMGSGIPISTSLDSLRLPPNQGT
jgi:hypothetical protein